MNKNSFFKNFSWTFIGSLVYAFSQWLLIITLAKLSSPDIVGQYSLALAITAPVVLFSNMQLSNILATDSRDEYSFSEYISTRIILLSISLIVIVCIVIFGTYNPSLSIVIVLVGLSKVVESLSELTHGYFQKVERMDYAGKSQIIKGITSVSIFILTFYFTNSLILSVVGMIGAWFLRLIYYDLRKVKLFTDVKVTINNSFKLITLFALPLGLVSILNSLNTNIPRYFLEYHFDLNELGYFSAIAYILVAGNLLIRPLSLVAAPKLAQNYQKNKKREFVILNIKLFLAAAILGFVAITIVYYFGEFILTFIYSIEYAKYNNIFLLIMIGSILSYFTTFLNVAIVAAREFKKQPYINLITMIAALLSSIYLIPINGIEGAAYVTIIVFLTQFLGSLSLFIYSVFQMKEV